MGRTVLMIAFHFPPAAMSSGHLRTLGFARYLPSSGWNPIVLSASPHAYPQTAPIESDTIPQGCMVRRALGFDTRRHFGLRGKYPAFLANPDRWISWWPAAVCKGLRLIRRHQVRAIWSTYPIMTAHCIARTLSRASGLPWIADFRDPVESSTFGAPSLVVASQQRWERRVLHEAARAVFTTPGALRDYARRYPEAYRQGRLAVIGNGYEETEFTALPQLAPPTLDRPLVLLHSGLLYPDGRDPVPFLTALARLKSTGAISPDILKVVLRASGCEPTYDREVQRLGLQGIVVLAPPVSNREALAEQARADGLLLFQGEKFDKQIPAKLYEYLRIGRPIFALVGEGGDTAALLRDVGGAELVPVDDVDVIEKGLRTFVTALRAGVAPPVRVESIGKYSRRASAISLAGLLDQVAAFSAR